MALVGCEIVHGPVRLRITEVEAYRSPGDSANHARSGRTARNAPMWGPPGRAYIYLCYGVHQMLNLVTGCDGGVALPHEKQRPNGPGRQRVTARAAGHTRSRDVQRRGAERIRKTHAHRGAAGCRVDTHTDRLIVQRQCGRRRDAGHWRRLVVVAGGDCPTGRPARGIVCSMRSGERQDSRCGEEGREEGRDDSRLPWPSSRRQKERNRTHAGKVAQCREPS